MAPNYLFVRYRTQDGRPEFGEIRGAVIEITPPRKGETRRGSKEGPWLGFTKMPVDKSLWEKLTTGQVTVDVEKTTEKKIVISSTPDLLRLEATKFLKLNQHQWAESSYYQQPASPTNYKIYAKTFLREFTRLTRHIPLDRQIDLYPAPWIVPTCTQIYVGRDGIALVYESPNRPEEANIIIDLDKILDELLLPHPKGKQYLSTGPNRLTKFKCSDENYVKIRVAYGNFIEKAELGNPDFIITERKYHGFWENLTILRGYGDGTSVKKKFQLVEFFGDISKTNFTEDKAKSRAKIYAFNWAANKITNEQITAFDKLMEITGELRAMVNENNISEPAIEKFLDRNPWMIERGLGYKRYHSQITIPKDFLVAIKIFVLTSFWRDMTAIVIYST